MSYGVVTISAAQLRNPSLGHPWDPRTHGRVARLGGRIPRKLKKRFRLAFVRELAATLATSAKSLRRTMEALLAP